MADQDDAARQAEREQREREEAARKPKPGEVVPAYLQSVSAAADSATPHRNVLDSPEAVNLDPLELVRLTALRHSTRANPDLVAEAIRLQIPFPNDTTDRDLEVLIARKKKELGEQGEGSEVRNG